MRTGKAILGMVAGVAAGTALGAWLATAKKRSKRKKISSDLAEAVNDVIDEKFKDLTASLSRAGETKKTDETV